MQNKLLSLLFFIIISMIPTQLIWAMPEIGKPAPTFEASDIEGESVSISENKGKIIVLSWYNKECPFDKKHHASPTKNMQTMQEYAKDKGVVWISILSSAPGKQGYETAEEAQKTVKDLDIKASHVILDPNGKIGRLFDAKTTPHMFIIKKDGTMGYMGAIDSIKSTNVEDIYKADKYFLDALDAIILDKEFKLNRTNPYGCSVKY